MSSEQIHDAMMSVACLETWPGAFRVSKTVEIAMSGGGNRRVLYLTANDSFGSGNFHILELSLATCEHTHTIKAMLAGEVAPAFDYWPNELKVLWDYWCQQWDGT